ncbi:hypothetical protein Naga_100133g3 [Nannochloropsis gaditana]|uniref:Uncharacterized protein n=1 Tax=Nannochloropsis gaditana TaxID=72520 RepID=W7TZD6_9STRA|nr:hypothetical protein Naga_100133g3 [Nannochloropsis gaditana]
MNGQTGSAQSRGLNASGVAFHQFYHPGGCCQSKHVSRRCMVPHPPRSSGRHDHPEHRPQAPPARSKPHQRRRRSRRGWTLPRPPPSPGRTFLAGRGRGGGPQRGAPREPAQAREWRVASGLGCSGEERYARVVSNSGVLLLFHVSHTMQAAPRSSFAEVDFNHGRQLAYRRPKALVGSGSKGELSRRRPSRRTLADLRLLTCVQQWRTYLSPGPSGLKREARRRKGYQKRRASSVLGVGVFDHKEFRQGGASLSVTSVRTELPKEPLTPSLPPFLPPSLPPSLRASL